MDRQQLLSILSVMDEDKLMQACQAVGVSCGGGGYGLSSDEPEAEGLSSWNATKVAIPSSARPSLFDRSAHVEAQAAKPRRMDPAAVLGDEQTGLEALAPTGQGQGMGY